MKKVAATPSSITSIVVPECIGIIMDGNRRFAVENKLSKLRGHTAGYKKLREMLQWCKRAGVKTLVAYAFSTENWNREQSEVSDLLGLLAKAIGSTSLRQRDLRVRIAGDTSRFAPELRRAITSLERDTAGNGPYTLVIALSYGGQDEILAAVNSLIKKGKQEISKEDIERAMWAGYLKPDLVLRTGGEMRLSNFMPWQTVYSELFFTKTLWPALSEIEFAEILIEYSKRKRNFGK
jgi:undecaprenyl diphosphate synthase